MNDTNQQFSLYEQSKKKKRYVVFVVLLLLFLGIGYAYLQTLLTISGTTNVSSSSWDVHWDNIQVAKGADLATSAATIAPSPSDSTLITFTVTLQKPGDEYQFTVDAVNDGTMDAMIATDGIVKTVTLHENGNDTELSQLPSYLEYEVAYSDEAPLADLQILRAGEVESYRLRVAYKEDINEGDLPGDDINLTISFDVNYVQANPTTAKFVDRTFYQVSDTSFTLGQTPPLDSVTTYTNYADAVAAFGHPVFLKHTISNNVISKSYVGFVYNDVEYLFEVGETGWDYDTTLSRLNEVFDNNCSGTSKISCQIGNILASFEGGHTLSIGDGSRYCEISHLQSRCGK